ncbi:hypothetical protein IW140_003321 [Coemansia sp. RSA 1813]|nr:hypothetical protein EV178_001817 [Coemansia sp. RSA 1646]KAJ1770572.1 hypothetical protein LPJ74_003099 [Coemansia sp. RSA 1843]KAJ2092992.1 hypothetical protein IW138_000706 [Coemansia sp. RSA 986]KAJ2211194.1 hypothetical protein EV179_005694 [Coemansia sp. RSA 487]KAJ2569101.1 hypothetical protein IW140_003321 [Coemansia sp. RSA 1813]
MTRRDILLDFSDKVAFVARKHFDTTYRGRADWEAVSSEMQIPLIHCLQNLDSRYPPFVARHIPETVEWSVEDISALKSFTETYFQEYMTVDDWTLAGKYMNICYSDCIAKMWALSTFQMTPLLFSQISEYRQAGLLWPTICCKIAATALPADTPPCSSDIVRYMYSTTNRDQLKPTKRPKAQFRISKHQTWTADEDKKLLDLLNRFDDGHDIDWNFISKSIGHSKNACRYRRILLTRSTNSKSSRSSSADSQ